MRPAQRARRLLKGHWISVISIQSIIMAASMLVLLMELALLRFCHLDTETIAYVSIFFTDKWAYGAVTVGTLLLDWLLVSPLLLGQSLYYWKIASGEEVSYAVFFSFYRRGYGRSLHWRFSLFIRRLLWTALCYLPAAFIMGYAELVRRNGSDTPLADITLMFCTLLGFLLLITGFIVSEMLMLRYLPAAYLSALNSENSIRNIFRQSRQTMHGHIAEMFGIAVGFIGWFVSCLLVLPYFYVSPLYLATRTAVIRRYMAEAKQPQRCKKKNVKMKVNGKRMAKQNPVVSGRL